MKVLIIYHFILKKKSDLKLKKLNIIKNYNNVNLNYTNFRNNSNLFELDSKNYLNNKFIFNPLRNDIGMYQKLEELENLSGSNQDKPSKFLMLALIRPEVDSKFCMGAKKTLDFASEIKST